MTTQQLRDARSALSRRHLVAGGLALAGGHAFAGGFGAAVLTLSGSRPARAADTLRFGLTPVFLNNDIQLLDALQSYLQTATGFPVELVTRRTYREVTSLLVSGQLHAAWICGYPYIQFRKDLELVAIPQWNGQPYYRSYLIVASDRDVADMAGLRDDIHAFSDPYSNSGYLVTRSLMHDLGLNPATFFRKTLYTYGHRNVIRAVASNLAQSGSVDGYVWDVMLKLEPELVSRTRVLRKSDWLGFPPVATSKKFAGSAMMTALASALIGMPSIAGGPEVLDLLQLSGFAAPDEKVFDGIAQMVARLGGVL